jgi:hypothetical protein
VPYQIRHTALTGVSLIHGRDIARAVAGHTTETMTARYDHSNLEKAFMVVRERNQQYKVVGISGDSDLYNTMPKLKIFRGEER